jgi:hypothetical protein
MPMTVQDVMTRSVVVAREPTQFHELVMLLSRERVSPCHDRQRRACARDRLRERPAAHAAARR